MDRWRSPFKFFKAPGFCLVITALFFAVSCTTFKAANESPVKPPASPNESPDKSTRIYSGDIPIPSGDNSPGPFDYFFNSLFKFPPLTKNFDKKFEFAGPQALWGALFQKGESRSFQIPLEEDENYLFWAVPDTLDRTKKSGIQRNIQFVLYNPKGETVFSPRTAIRNPIIIRRHRAETSGMYTLTVKNETVASTDAPVFITVLVLRKNEEARFSIDPVIDVAKNVNRGRTYLPGSSIVIPGYDWTLFGGDVPGGSLIQHNYTVRSYNYVDSDMFFNPKPFHLLGGGESTVTDLNIEVKNPEGELLSRNTKRSRPFPFDAASFKPIKPKSIIVPESENDSTVDPPPQVNYVYVMQIHNGSEDGSAFVMGFLLQEK